MANYYYFNDRQCLEQALLVARAQPINLKSLEKWHGTEGQLDGYQLFLARLSEGGGTGKN
ncbi:MAG: hypothetical protein V3T17_20425 [Pseudomonadales bacterium]